MSCHDVLSAHPYAGSRTGTDGWLVLVDDSSSERTSVRGRGRTLPGGNAKGWIGGHPGASAREAVLMGVMIVVRYIDREICCDGCCHSWLCAGLL